MSFLIKRWWIIIGKKLQIISKKELDSEHAYNEKYLRNKIKFYKRKINTNFHNNNIPKGGSHCISLSLILILSWFTFMEKMKNVLLKCF